MPGLTGIPLTLLELMEARLKLELTERAAGGADAFVVTSEEAVAASRRWLGIDPRLVAAGESPVELYEELLSRRT